jgi:hypothetical protein
LTLANTIATAFTASAILYTIVTAGLATTTISSPFAATALAAATLAPPGLYCHPRLRQRNRHPFHRHRLPLRLAASFTSAVATFLSSTIASALATTITSGRRQRHHHHQWTPSTPPPQHHHSPPGLNPYNKLAF